MGGDGDKWRRRRHEVSTDEVAGTCAGCAGYAADKRGEMLLEEGMS